MISISLCTCNRPSLFEKALLSLSKLKLIDKEVILVVVDNDPAGSGFEVFKQFQSYLPFKSYYFCELTKGITYARNRALLESINLNATALAFFDDDAEVDPMWLKNLYDLFKNDKKLIVTGPQLSRFPNDAPDWSKEIVYFNPKRRKDKSEVSWAATNNVIFPLSVYKEHKILFDNAMRFTGGSDQCFFMNCVKVGYKIIWSDNAIVTEYVPNERLTIDWVKNRSYRYGTTGFYLQKQKYNYILALILSIGKATIYLTLGSILYFSSMKYNINKINGVCLIKRGQGWLSGIFGRRYMEYISR
ncbi:TPA: glycosyltransferase [Photobacterium damselae]